MPYTRTFDNIDPANSTVVIAGVEVGDFSGYMLVLGRGFAMFNARDDANRYLAESFQIKRGRQGAPVSGTILLNQLPFNLLLDETNPSFAGWRANLQRSIWTERVPLHALLLFGMAVRDSTPPGLLALRLANVNINLFAGGRFVAIMAGDDERAKLYAKAAHAFAFAELIANLTVTVITENNESDHQFTYLYELDQAGLEIVTFAKFDLPVMAVGNVTEIVISSSLDNVNPNFTPVGAAFTELGGFTIAQNGTLLENTLTSWVGEFTIERRLNMQFHVSLAAKEALVNELYAGEYEVLGGYVNYVYDVLMGTASMLVGLPVQL